MRKISIVWLTEARIEKDEIIDYIAERNVLAALGVDQHIDQQVGQLAEFPSMAKKGASPTPSSWLFPAHRTSWHTGSTRTKRKFCTSSTNAGTGR